MPGPSADVHRAQPPVGALRLLCRNIPTDHLEPISGQESETEQIPASPDLCTARHSILARVPVPKRLVLPQVSLRAEAKLRRPSQRKR